MSDPEHWDEKHRAAEDIGVPLSVVTELAPTLPRGRALDLACGRGRHALFLAREGFEVLAVDWSSTALRRLREEAERQGLTVTARGHDLVEDGVPAGRFELVLVTRYLERELFPAIQDAVAPGGSLLYETFGVAHHEQHGRPSRGYCLEPGELREAFPELTVVSEWTGELEGLLARRPS
ncbi:MAG: methyltransferase domain-containing protein [Acidobacteriota bacterium]